MFRSSSNGTLQFHNCIQSGLVSMSKVRPFKPRASQRDYECKERALVKMYVISLPNKACNDPHD